MTEPEYTLAWELLRDWTAWLIGRYRLALEGRLPDCWPRHPELIEELWALRAWRAEAYGPDGAGQSAVYWHQALVAFLGHVSTWWAGGCRAGHASPDTDVHPDQMREWSKSDPLAGIPAPMRPVSSGRMDSEAGQAVIGLPGTHVLSAAHMRALVNEGLARPEHEDVVAFTYYDGSWWAYEGETWFRADDIDFAET